MDTVPVCDKDVISVQYNDNQVKTNMLCTGIYIIYILCLVNMWIWIVYIYRVTNKG